ncbi:GNAT family N-acetyltransferase (plasmid) [Cytobacillus spongiae]|uniref:GNAT family N-acetyltransferase n=1 Tax=Cytobacillus spongiae TaxID=2901381 RepID=UPI00145C6C18|nr:GNAT family N-acetyltransferase [Cytobacillus spongiae]MCA1062665.1 GNAT family N-acetyltransferase [Rossellomorea aquimaris]NMH70009.1 GNAT family N-acetyltransferase [Bacillus sp. RO3]UII58298.1 GNAT family N-acetyltransferase [Cytobacillus spongiae]WJV28670.1 GNAT family N-acetyltransferase [Rossellomorea sp. AcN35-11]
MEIITYATMLDVDAILKIDMEVIGNNSRYEEIKLAIEEKRCLIAREEDTCNGFLLFNTHFFECTFVSLLIVSPTKRRRGYASSLLKFAETISPTEKIFSSTNQSNVEMQKVFLINGYSESGKIENLDPGDPEIIYFKEKQHEKEALK